MERSFGELESPLGQFWGPNKGGFGLPVTAFKLWFSCSEWKLEGKANHCRAVAPMARGGMGVKRRGVVVERTALCKARDF